MGVVRKAEQTPHRISATSRQAEVAEHFTHPSDVPDIAVLTYLVSLNSHKNSIAQCLSHSHVPFQFSKQPVLLIQASLIWCPVKSLLHLAPPPPVWQCSTSQRHSTRGAEPCHRRDSTSGNSSRFRRWAVQFCTRPRPAHVTRPAQPVMLMSAGANCRN